MSWAIGETHPVYGTVVAMANYSEPYRWFQSDDGVAMIPVSALEKDDEGDE